MTKQNQKCLKELKKYLHNIIDCVNDIESGITEIKACETHNIDRAAFRKLLFDEKLGYQKTERENFDIEKYISSPYERLYQDIFSVSDISLVPPDVDETMPYVFIEYLTTRERDIIRYIYVDNMTFKEAGKMCHLSESQASNIRKAVLQKLGASKPSYILKYGKEYYNKLNEIREDAAQFNRKHSYLYLTHDIFSILSDAENAKNAAEMLKRLAEEIINKYNGYLPNKLKDGILLDHIRGIKIVDIQIPISTKLRNILMGYHGLDPIETLGDLYDIYMSGKLEQAKGIGPKAIEEVKDILKEYHLLNRYSYF